MSIDTEQRKGAIFACLAFFMWGLAPIYFKMIQHVSAFEILMHRVIWSVMFLILVVSVLNYWNKIKRILIQPKLILMLVV